MDVPVPHGWIELEDHLADLHEQDARDLHLMDHHALRKLHRRLHWAEVFPNPSKRHRHVV